MATGANFSKVINCEKNHSKTPNLCLVHPSMLEQDQKQIELGKLIIRAYRSILPGHFWIGIEDQK